jgi:hypothetical protein
VVGSGLVVEVPSKEISEIGVSGKSLIVGASDICVFKSVLVSAVLVSSRVSKGMVLVVPRIVFNLIYTIKNSPTCPHLFSH